MKIILNDEKQETIGIKDINENYLVVAIIKGDPCILRKGTSEENKFLLFGVLNEYFTEGNGYGYSHDEDTVQKMTEYALRNGNKVEAFHQDDWKEALQWLIDNAE